MDGILRKQLEFVESLVVLEASVGIQPQFYLVEGEAFADSLHQIQFLLKVDGTHLQFHASEALLQLLLQPLEHLVVASHPNQAIDRNALLAAAEGGVEEPVAALQVEQSRLQSEEHRGIGAQGLVVDGSRLAEIRAYLI